MKRLELRPVASILEEYLADLADRAGLPRPGILAAASPPSSAARSRREGEARSHPCEPNPRSGPRTPPSKADFQDAGG